MKGIARKHRMIELARRISQLKDTSNPEEVTELEQIQAEYDALKAKGKKLIKH